MASKRDAEHWRLRKDKIRFGLAVGSNVFVVLLYFIVAPFYKASQGVTLELPDIRAVLTVTVGLGAPALAVNPNRFRQALKTVLDSLPDDTQDNDEEAANVT